LLVNNAGVMATPFERTVDGFELQFGTNAPEPLPAHEPVDAGLVGLARRPAS